MDAFSERAYESTRVESVDHENQLYTYTYSGTFISCTDGATDKTDLTSHCHGMRGGTCTLCSSVQIVACNSSNRIVGLYFHPLDRSNKNQFLIITLKDTKHSTF